MFNSEVLEVGIGMAFLFLFVSLVCTAVKEWLEGIFKWRALDLERALRQLLADPQGRTTQQLLAHPLLVSLFPGGYEPTQLRSSWFTPGSPWHMRLSQRRNLPSYIPAAQFAAALLDSVARGVSAVPPPAVDAAKPAKPAEAAEAGAFATQPKGELDLTPMTVDALRAGAQGLGSAHLQRVVAWALDQSGGDLTQARAQIELWFNGTMDRASGWYRRRTQTVLFLLGLGVAMVLNIDALTVMHRLSADKAFRELVVQQAQNVQTTQGVTLDQARAQLAKADMPIGWNGVLRPIQLCQPRDEVLTCLGAQPSATAAMLVGWLATAFAVMLGAPFWFDVLNKFMVVRSTVKPREKSHEEGSEDRPATTGDTTSAGSKDG